MPTPLGLVLVGAMLLVIALLTTLKILGTIGIVLAVIGVCWLIYSIIVQGGRTPRV